MKELEKIFATSPKFPDCLSVSIGLCGDNLSEMKFSCRGRLGNINGYLVWGSYSNQRTEFACHCLVNACKKYSPNELRVSIYDTIGGEQLLACGSQLPHVKKAVHFDSFESLLSKTVLFDKRFTERLNRITSLGEQCFVRAARNPDINRELNMAQELIFFNTATVRPFEKYQLTHESDYFFHLVTQCFWRVGVYPVFISNDGFSVCYHNYEYFFPNEIVFGPNITHYKTRQEIGVNQVLNYTGWDSWDFLAQREEIVDLPNFPDEWIEKTVKEIQDIHRQ